MSSNDALEHVRRWLDSSSIAFEMQVARSLAAYTQVQEAVPYLDPIEGKDREADVVADFGPIRMVVECKSSEASPWVAIAPTGQMWSPELPTFMIPESGPILESSMDRELTYMKVRSVFGGPIGTRIGVANTSQSGKQGRTLRGMPADR